MKKYGNTINFEPMCLVSQLNPYCQQAIKTSSELHLFLKIKQFILDNVMIRYKHVLQRSLFESHYFKPYTNSMQMMRFNI